MYLGFWRPVALKPAPLLGVGRKCALELSNSGLTVSIGARLVKPGETVELALQKADEALYGAKNGGRNTVRLNA